jgi:hypothetical protein
VPINTLAREPTPNRGLQKADQPSLMVKRLLNEAGAGKLRRLGALRVNRRRGSLLGEETNPLDVLALLKVMAAALREPGPVDWVSIAPAIGLRLQGVRLVGRSDSASAIEDGKLIESGTRVEGVIYQTPPRRISMFFPDKKLGDAEIATRLFAVDQRIVPSRTGGEYAILFNIGDIDCAVLVSGPGGSIDGLTASEVGQTDSARAGSNRLTPLG